MSFHFDEPVPKSRSNVCPERPNNGKKIYSDRFGEFVVDMIVVVDKTAYDGKEDFEMTVEQALTETVDAGKIGVLSVDPKSLELRAPGSTRLS
jgi:hypothetical protein